MRDPTYDDNHPLPGDWNYHPKGGVMKRAILRFARVVVAAALAAAVSTGIEHIGELPISDRDVIVVITAALTAFDKFARDRGWY